MVKQRVAIKEVFGEFLRRLDSLRYMRAAIFIVSGCRTDDMKDSSEKVVDRDPLP